MHPSEQELVTRKEIWEMSRKAKMGSKRDLDDLPYSGSEHGSSAMYSSYGSMAGSKGSQGFYNHPLSDDAKKMKHEHSYSQSSSDKDKENMRDEEGHLLLKNGDVLGGRFKVHSLMGTGTFGKVYRCEDAKHNDIVAVKVIRKVDRYIKSAKTEAAILKSLYRAQEDKSWQPTVTMFTHVYHDGHYCMAFEPLGKSLLDYIQLNRYHGFPKYMVKQIAYQLLHALDFIHRLGMVHTDLKLENILFKEGPEMELLLDSSGSGGGGGGENGHSYRSSGTSNGTQSSSSNSSSSFSSSPPRSLRLPKTPHIKLIDFGGAVFEGMHHSKVINTRQYRSPEVILDLGWSCPSDVWSAGCIIAECLSGDLLFSTHDDLEHLYMIERVVEGIPDRMRSRSPVGRNYFHNGGWDAPKRRNSRGDNSSTGHGQSRGPMPLRAELLSTKSKNYSNDLPTLRQFSSFVAQAAPESRGRDGHDPDMEEMLFELLRVDPAKRGRPDQVAVYKWFADVVDSPVHSFGE